MNKEMLEILKAINNNISSLQQDINTIKINIDDLTTKANKIDERLSTVEHKIDIIYDQTINLTEFKTHIEEKANEVSILNGVTKDNCYDIAKLKAIVSQS